jgi:hypothetical protein
MKARILRIRLTHTIPVLSQKTDTSDRCLVVVSENQAMRHEKQDSDQVSKRYPGYPEKSKKYE